MKVLTVHVVDLEIDPNLINECNQQSYYGFDFYCGCEITWV